MIRKPALRPENKSHQRRKEARPAEILDAAFKEFADKGFGAARLEDVAARAGIAKGTIYVYFESKEAVFEAAVRSRVLPVLEEVEALVDTFPGTSADLLKHFIAAFYARIADPGTRMVIRILIADGPAFPGLVQFYHREVVSKAESLLRRVVERGIARGEFHSNGATDLPIVLIGPGLMAAIWQMIFYQLDPVPLQQFEAAHIDLVLSGLRRTHP